MKKNKLMLYIKIYTNCLNIIFVEEVRYKNNRYFNL